MNKNFTQKNIILITRLTRDSAIKYSKHLLDNYELLDKISKEALSKISIIEYCKCFLFNKLKNQNDIGSDIRNWIQDFRINLFDGMSEEDKIIHERFMNIRNTEWAHSDENAFDIEWYIPMQGIEIPISRSTDYVLPKFDLSKIISFSELQIRNLIDHYLE